MLKRNKIDAVGAMRLLTWLLIGAAWLLAAALAAQVYPDNPGAAELARAFAALWLSLPVLFFAARDLWRGNLTMNALVALAVLAAFSAGEYYTAAAVALLMLLSVVVETRTAAGAGASIEALVRMAPSTANRIDANGVEMSISISDLIVGDCVRVRPGESLPVDGVIRSGRTTLDEAVVTGESLPVDKAPGEHVFAGTHNLTGMIEVVVDRVGGATTLGRVRELIQAAENSRLPVTRLIDVFVRYYIPLVLMIALLVWLVTGELRRVIAMLVIACPCALILAAPAAMVAALSSAARHGVLLKHAADLEIMAKINAFVFDKTGTLTRGVPRVARLAPVDRVTPAELLLCAAAVEQFSNHPLAQALRRLCVETKAQPPEPQDFKEVPGCGVAGVVNGEITLAGQADWLESSHGISLPPPPVEAEEQGWSVLWVVRGGLCIGWIGFGDEVRSTAAECLRELEELRVERIAMVTGDRPAPAAAVASAINCREVLDRCLPKHKVDFVDKLRGEGWRVAVVGDGINDAPALAAGNIGIAMGAAGSEVAVHSADIALMNSNLKRLPFLLRLARRTHVVVLQNITFGLVLIAGGLILAGWGLLHPIAAALIHNCGSLLIALNSARLVGRAVD